MTTNVIHEAKSADGQAKEAMALPIGDSDAHVFTCPSCARPLSEGTSRCPGCGVRLIMGVRMKRAGAILGLGIALGILLGGVTTAAAITLSLHDPVPAVVAAPSVAPSVASAASAAPSFSAIDPSAPAAAVSALSGTAVVNGRISVDADTLSSTLHRSNVTTIEMARALRSLAADAALGIDLANRIAPWTEAAQVRTDLDDFYRAMATAARTGLRASLNDSGAYRKAGTDMLRVLATMGAVDAQSRTLAGTIGLELPPVVLPTS